MKYPVQLTAEYRGLERNEGSFDRESDGVTVQYGRLHRFEVELPDGTTDDLALRETALDQAADFDVAKLAKGEFVSIVGIVGEGRDGGVYLRPVEVKKAAKPAAVRAA